MLKRAKPKDQENPAVEGKSGRKSPGAAQSTSNATSTHDQSSYVNVGLLLVALGWFFVVYKGAQLTKRHGLHLPVANYLGMGLGEDPIIPGLAYSILSNERSSLLICENDGYCKEVPMSPDMVRKSCFAAAEVHDDMDDRGSLTHSRIFYIAYACPGPNYLKWLTYTMEDKPYKKALRVKLVEKKADASPWRLYKDSEGEKLQCFLDGPGRDHWMGIYKETGDSVLVLHADSIDSKIRHSSFTFAMVADSVPSVLQDYAVFHEGVKGFLTCGSNQICRVTKSLRTSTSSCFKLHRHDDSGQENQYRLEYRCPGPSFGSYLSTVIDETTGNTHVGLTPTNDHIWKVEQKDGHGSHISLTTGAFQGYILGPSIGEIKKEFYFIRRANVTVRIEAQEKEEQAKDKEKFTEANPVADSAKYSTKDFKFIGCYVDKWDRDLPKGPRKWGFNKETCMAACKDFLHFAMQGGSWCSCGNTYGKHGKAPELECNDEQDSMQGGNFRNAVYEILKR
eukprot:CAMPEP_0184486184 /NCGR_PEP_ID=MMETSP0113_2-20130426/7724_1 /TAXON_ID=91329 /ORGANISM="Norrisiella sphaerica, Strain BC52" /LENGTH=506 /DNA_ID=CAMNT_0026867943 /DNA_START=66 /DNA_END=1586 /DNA_ORIENTATION=+